MGIKDINSTLKSVVDEVVNTLTLQQQIKFQSEHLIPLQQQISQLSNTLSINQTQELINQYDTLINQFNSLISQYSLIKQEMLGYRSVPISFFTGTRIAVDISIVINAKMNIAHNELLGKQRNIAEKYAHHELMTKTKKLILGFLSTFIANGITPVIVFDGKMHPAKQDCVSGRIEISKNRHANANAIIDNYINLSPLERTQEVENNTIAALKNTVKISQADKEEIFKTLQDIGFPCLRAEYDGENLCAALSIEGLVSAVFGNDTDNYVLGTKILITEVKFEDGNHMCKIVIVDELKWCLSFKFNRQITDISFLDLCILHGCDFNNYSRLQIPQKKDASKTKSVGPKGALDLIQQYNQFENFPQEYMYQLCNVLKVGICRQIFTYSPSNLKESDCNIDWDIYSIRYRDCLNEVRAEGYIIGAFSRANPGTLKINYHEQIDQLQQLQQIAPTKDSSSNYSSSTIIAGQSVGGYTF